MADENDVKIKLSLDGDTAVITGLKGVGDEAKTSDSKLSSLASNGLKGVAIGATAMLAAATAAGAGLFKIASGAAEAGEDIDAQSQKLGLSTKGYQEWSYVLQQSGASIDTLKAGMTHLNTSVDQAISGTGDAADKFARLGISVDDLKGKTREQIFDATITGLQGVSDAGQRAAIATSLLGRSAAELNPLLNSSGANTEALKEKAEALGLVMSDKAVAAAHDYTDSLETLKDTVSGLKNNLGAELLPGLSKVMDGLSGLLVGTKGADDLIKQGADELETAINVVAPKILNIFSQLLGGVAIVAPQIIGSLVDGIVANLPSLVTTLTGAIVNLVTLLAKELPAIVTAGATAIVALANGISTALPTLIPVIITGLLAMVSAVIKALPLLIQAGITLVLGLQAGILAAIPEIIAALPGLISAIVSFIVTSIPALLNAAVSLFTALVTALPIIITQLLSALPGMITAIIGAIVGAIPLIIQAGIQLLTALVTALPVIITSIVAALPQIITSIITAVVSAIPQLIQAGIQLFLALINALPTIIVAIVGAIPQIIVALISGIIAAIPAIIKAGIELLISLVKDLPTIIAALVKAIPEIITGLYNAFTSPAMIAQLAKAGSQLIQGIWQGIESMAAWLNSKIASFFGGVVSSIKSFFGIHSPSKLMADEIGAMLPAGIGLGVTVNADSAIKPIQDLNSQILDAASSLNTSVAFTHDTTLTSLTPSSATPTPYAPVGLTATIDSTAIANAIEQALAPSQGQEQAALALADASINKLAAAIITGMRTQSRTGAPVNG